LAAGGRYPGRESVRRNHARPVSWLFISGPERNAPRLPLKRVCQRGGRRDEPKDVRGNVIRLDRKLRVLGGGIPPLTEFDVDFPMVLPRLKWVPRKHPQHATGLQARNLTHDKRVRAVAETAR